MTGQGHHCLHNWLLLQWPKGMEVPTGFMFGLASNATVNKISVAIFRFIFVKLWTKILWRQKIRIRVKCARAQVTAFRSFNLNSGKWKIGKENNKKTRIITGTKYTVVPSTSRAEISPHFARIEAPASEALTCQRRQRREAGEDEQSSDRSQMPEQ